MAAVYASRGGHKLAAALSAFGLDPAGMVCADLGSSTGGFCDCLLAAGARRVYAVDTAHGALHYRLRSDPRVVCLERTNAMHVVLPEPCELVTVDLGWTRQDRILPNAARLLAPSGSIVTLVKPHYESPEAWLRRGILPDERISAVLAQVEDEVAAAGLRVVGRIESPIRGQRGNREFLWHLEPSGAGIRQAARDAQ